MHARVTGCANAHSGSNLLVATHQRCRRTISPKGLVAAHCDVQINLDLSTIALFGRAGNLTVCSTKPSSVMCFVYRYSPGVVPSRTYPKAVQSSRIRHQSREAIVA
jgi:hypothetical protein